MKKHFFILCVLFSVCFFLGQYVTLLLIGADYGINSKLFSTSNNDGFYPHYETRWPSFFDLRDQEGVVLGPGFSYSRSSISIKEILSYSFYKDTLYVECLDGEGLPIFLRPEEAHGNSVSCLFERVSSYPKEAVAVQISGNEGLLSYIVHLKRISRVTLLSLLFIIICFCFSSQKRFKRNTH